MRSVCNVWKQAVDEHPATQVVHPDYKLSPADVLDSVSWGCCCSARLFVYDHTEAVIYLVLSGKSALNELNECVELNLPNQLNELNQLN